MRIETKRPVRATILAAYSAWSWADTVLGRLINKIKKKHYYSVNINQCLFV